MLGYSDITPMILAQDPTEYEPLGGRFVAENDCESQARATSSNPVTQLLFEDSLVENIRLVNINDVSQPHQVVYEVNKSEVGGDSGDCKWMNEPRVDDVIEIYSKGNQVVCSSYLAKHILKRFRVDFPIIQTFYYTFNCENVVIPNSEVDSRKWGDNKVPGKCRCICIVGSQRIEVRSDDGQMMLSISLPFQVSQVWPTQYGLLLARVPSIAEKSSPHRGEEPIIPLFYTMAHPLNEVLPVIISHTSGWRGQPCEARYACDVSMKPVFCSESPSLLLMYHASNACHSLFHVRKASKEDALSAARKLEQSMCSMTSSINCSISKTPAGRAWNGGGGDTPMGTPLPSRSNTATVSTSNINTESSSMGKVLANQ